MNFSVKIKRLTNKDGGQRYLLTINNVVSWIVKGAESKVIEVLKQLRKELEKLPHGADLSKFKGMQ